MFYVMQILNLIKTKEDLELFDGLFDDLSFEIDEMGYKGHEAELINEILDNHLGLFIEDERQLKEFTNCILSKSYKSAWKIEMLKRGYEVAA